MAHLAASTAQASPGPRTPLQNERQEQKRDLAGWWKNFKRSDKKPPEPQVPQGIFGIPLQHSIRYANVAISLINDQGHSYIYGYVPIVVAKCGVFLKDKATETEGIFRLAGSEKRIKELKVAFDSPDRFGKGLDWTGYTVHDAANILRRYFNQLPEPIIPLGFYNRFRDPLRNHQAQAVGHIEAQSPSVGDFDADATIQIYQKLITELPPLNRQLLLYILDLLAVFASKSDVNKMTTPNLAAIFQPGILSHPSHDMAPPEYRLSQDVLIFLIENQDSFLIGMQGTEADAQTVRDVSSGTPPPKTPGSPSTPGRSKTIIGRSSSNASTRAESLRKVTDLRRNVSVSSKQSKRSENGPSPVPAGMSPSGSVHRSNTVPSRRDGSNAQSPRITREKVSEEAADSPAIVVDTAKPRQESLQSTPVAATAPQFPAAEAAVATSTGAAIAIEGSAAREVETPSKDKPSLPSSSTSRADQSTERPAVQTPSASPGRFLDIFKQSPTDDGRKPNKLQKKQRIPGAALSSAQSSTQSLGTEENPNSTQQSAVPPVNPIVANDVQDYNGATASGVSANAQGGETAAATSTASPNAPAALADPSRNLSADHGLRPTISPSHSYRSATESDAEMVGDDMPKESTSPLQKEKRRHRWRFSRSQNKLETSPPPSSNPLGTLNTTDQTTSRSTVGSNGGRKSFQEPTSAPAPLASSNTDPVAGSLAQGQTFSSSSTDPAVFSDSEREKKSGPMSWIRGKMAGHKDKDAEKRARTPSRGPEVRESRSELQTPGDAIIPVRGKSIEAQRNNSESAPVSNSPPIAATSSTTTTMTTATPGAVVAAQIAAGSSPTAGSNGASPPATFSTPPTSSHGDTVPGIGPIADQAATTE